MSALNWLCPECETVNDLEHHICEVCGEPSPVAVAAYIEKNGEALPTSANVAAPTVVRSSKTSAYILGTIIGVVLSTLGVQWYQSNEIDNLLGTAFQAYINCEYEEAYKLYAVAYEEGSGEASYYLGRMYENGYYVETNGVKAKDYTQEAVDRGYKLAVFDLGYMYLYGHENVDKDSVKAKRYFRMVFDLIKEEADSRNMDAANLLGLVYLNGWGTAKDSILAFQYFRKAAIGGYPIAMHNTAQLYMKGIGVDKNPYRAIHWYEKASFVNYSKSIYALGEVYFNGIGIKQDYVKAFTYFEQAAHLGHGNAMFFLGLMYSNGNGVDKNLTEAAYWYRKSAELGYAGSQNNLGLLYEEGEGVNRSYQDAEKWFLQSANAGNAYAQKNLHRLYKFKLNNLPEATKWLKAYNNNPYK